MQELVCSLDKGVNPNRVTGLQELPRAPNISGVSLPPQLELIQLAGISH